MLCERCHEAADELYDDGLCIDCVEADAFGITNADRAMLVEKALTDLFDLVDQDAATALTDLLADARHYCDEQDLDYAECDRMAYQHYIVEKRHSPTPRPSLECPYCGNKEEFEDHEGLGHQKRCLQCGRLL